MREFSKDPTSGMTTTYKDTPDGFELHTTHDAAAVVNLNKEKRNAGREYYAQNKDMWKVASIPVGVQLKWMIEDGLDIYNPDHKDRLKKKLNDPEWRYLKTAEVII